MAELPATAGDTAPKPDGLQGEILRLVAVLSRTESHFVGPLPPPEALKGYEDASKGAAKRILDLAERQAEHRQKVERLVIERDARRADLGLFAGFVLCFTALVGGTIAICLGHDAAGATVATGSLIGLAGVFIYGTNSRASERASRIDKLTGVKSTPFAPAKSDQP